MNRDQLKELLSKRPFLYAIYKLLKYHNNKDFLNRVNNQTPEFYLPRNTFHLSTGRTYYVMERDWGINGFFAIMSFCLMDFAVADSLGFIPYVNINQSLYNVKGGWRGVDNMYEYYFMQPIPDSLERIKREENFFYAKASNRAGIRDVFEEHEIYAYSDEQLQYLGSIAKKYMRIRPELEQELNAEITEILGNRKTIGIHFRGSDYRQGFKSHPLALTVEQYYDCIDEAMKVGFEQIFLATDDAAAVEAFRVRYGNAVRIYTAVVRTEGTTGVHMMEHKEEDKYGLGREVLRDMLTLSKCSGLIAGLSNVSKFVRIWKYANEEKFEYMKIINNGFYQKNSKEAKAAGKRYQRK